jgi:hypothetical protein
MASGTRGSSVPRFSTTGRAMSLQHVLKNVIECDLTSPLYEPVATNTIYSDTPAIDCGITSAQLFVGTKTHTGSSPKRRMSGGKK